MIGTIVNCTAIIIGSILVASNKENKKIAKIIEDNIASAEVKFKDKKAKEIDEIIDYRNSLLKLGINPNKFLFYGFLDSKKSQKKKELEELKSIKYTIIFYESPYRVIETLLLIKEIMGNRNMSVSREISKKYEEIYRGTIDDVLNELVEPKGEFVIIVEGNKEEKSYDNIDILSHVKALVLDGISEKEAIKTVAKLHNLEKNEVYMKYHGGK